MERSKAARSVRRAAGRLRLGGGAAPCLAGGVQESVTPDEGDQGEVAMQARPGPALVVAQPELLLAVLVEPLDRPALVGQAELRVERAVVEGPGEVPLGFAILTGQRALSDQPAEWAGGVAVSAVDAQAARLPLAPLLLGIEDGDRDPLRLRHGGRQRLGGVQRRNLGGMRMETRAPRARVGRLRCGAILPLATRSARRRQGARRRLGDLLWSTGAERLGDLDDVRLLPRL